MPRSCQRTLLLGLREVAPLGDPRAVGDTLQDLRQDK